MRRFSIPCMTSLLAAALYNIVDQIFIANADYLGSHGNAANTVVFPLTVIALSIALLIGDGCCSYVSIALGSGYNGNAKRSVGSSILLCLGCSAAITAVYFIFMEPILSFFGGKVNPETYARSREYFTIIALGIPFYMFGEAMNPIIRSDGNPRYAMLATLSGAAVNIILDPIFIFVFRWGMTGAALATVLGQILTTILDIVYLCRMRTMRLDKEAFRFSPTLCGKILPLGFSSFLSQITLVFSMAAIQNMLVKYGAADEVFSQLELTHIPMAVLGIVTKFFGIVTSITIGLAAGCLPIVGYNIGAGLRDRAKQLLTRLLLAEATVGAVALIVVEIFPGVIIALFGGMDEGPHYINFAIKSFRIYLCSMILATLNKGMAIYLQALGKAAASTALSLARELVFGMGFALLLPAYFGLDGVLCSMPASDMLTFVFTVIFIRKTYRELSVPAASADFQNPRTV